MANVSGGHSSTPNPNQRPSGTRFRTSPSQVQSQQNAHPAGRSAGHARPVNQGQARPAGTRFANQPRPAQSMASAHRASAHAHVAPAYTRSQPQKKSSPVPVILGVVIAIAVVALVTVFVFPKVFGGAGKPTVEPGQQVTLTIPEGAGGDTIASILAENHVIDEPTNYYSAVKKLGAETSLKPGNYQFVTGQDPIDVVKQLMVGPNGDTKKLVIPEGKTVNQTAAIVFETYGISADDFKAQAKASNYVSEFSFLEGAANDSLEGFLFPKTYIFNGSPSADDVIRAMLKQYQLDVIDVINFDAARALVQERYGIEMSNYELLTLASVVEREGLNAEQRAHVAGVFFNRLAGRMDGRPYLESDATLMYETGGEVTADDIQNSTSPYNSYKFAGVPPTPICSPSVEAISATLNPMDTQDLYFFITMDEEYFSQTYDEHMKSWQ